MGLAGGPADTLCLHADTPDAVANARAVRAALSSAGIEVLPMGAQRGTVHST
jgi:lactam utilization protein B